MANLLFEIGVEEVPAALVSRALDYLARASKERLEAERLAPGEVATFGTPRRLALWVEGIPDRQPDLSERVVGPPARAAFKDGKPTKAAEGFARKNGVTTDDLEVTEVEGKKGEYVVCTRQEAGRPAADVLPAVLEHLISSIPWPKSMRWDSREETFVRPMHWIVALLGGELVPVSYAGIESGRATRGHRFLAPAAIDLSGDKTQYVEALREASVVVDPVERRAAIVRELAGLEADGATMRPDDELIDEVTNLVELPVGVLGSFSESFMEVPDEVIVSAMRSHQRYFAYEKDGALVNKFATIANTRVEDPAAVRSGNERVLAARLADAQFFFREDRKVGLDDWAQKLDSVVFQSKLGSIGDKARRVAGLAANLAEAGLSVDAGTVERAAAVCKADLVTSMVYEFPDLQGVMGAHYARLQGEPAAVCDAIVEHYAPRGAGDELPQSPAGAALAIADRLDTIVGCWAAGLAPTGSADAYGLRRAALGVIAILLDRGWRVGLDRLIADAKDQLADTIEVSDQAVADIAEFIRVRLRGVLAEGLPGDCVDAALAAGYDDLPAAAARARAVAALRQRDDFEPLATAFKRVANMLKGQKSDGTPAPDKFIEKAEKDLWTSFSAVRGDVDQYLASDDYDAALTRLAELKAPVDTFFTDVMVIHDDKAVRANRLALLGTINQTFTRIADFRQLAV